MFDSLRSTTLTRFILLYAAMYAAFGVASPFLPAFISARGLSPEQLGLVLGAGTAVRLLTAPLAGRIGDLIQALRVVLVVCIALAASVTLGYLAATWILDFAWDEPAACRVAGADYHLGGRIGARICFSAAEQRPPGLRVWMGARHRLGRLHRRHFAVRAGGERIWPRPDRLATGFATRRGGFCRDPGPGTDSRSHSRCRASAGGRCSHSPPASAVSESCSRGSTHSRQPCHARRICGDPLECRRHRPGYRELALVRVGRRRGAGVLRHWPGARDAADPAGAAAIAALAGMLRWAVMAQTTDVMALALVQPLHGITFALLHLACMRLMARTVPQGLEGTAQAIYGTVGIGAATALLIFVSGALYARLGAQGFWVMAALCALALPLTWKLRQPVFGKGSGINSEDV